MRHHALACDYDGTIAHDGQVDQDTIAGLERLADSGRRLVLVTGRELDDLHKVLPQDEAHHLLPAESDAAEPASMPQLDGLILVAPRAGSIDPDALRPIGLVLALGDDPAATIADYRTAVGMEPPQTGPVELDKGQVLGWWRDGKEPFVFRYAPGTVERRRHVRKYAEGDLGEDKSFWFRGPDGALDLRAQNLRLFLQLGDGVDDRTWLHHLRRGDYARWFRESIKDETLAAEAEDIQRRHADDSAQSRARLREAIEHRYAAPA